MTDPDLRILSKQHVGEYDRFLSEIKPADPDQFFRILMFCILSVNMDWKSNCRLYDLLKDCHWVNYDEAHLGIILGAHNSGMHNVKARLMSSAWKVFNRDWRDNWNTRGIDIRDDLMKSFTGLGITKASFVCELCSFDPPRFICLDRHMLRKFFNKPVGIPESEYRAAELEWCAACWKRGLNPQASRLAAWDLIHGRVNSFYWSKSLTVV